MGRNLPSASSFPFSGEGQLFGCVYLSCMDTESGFQVEEVKGGLGPCPTCYFSRGSEAATWRTDYCHLELPCCQHAKPEDKQPVTHAQGERTRVQMNTRAQTAPLLDRCQSIMAHSPAPMQLPGTIRAPPEGLTVPGPKPPFTSST